MDRRDRHLTNQLNGQEAGESSKRDGVAPKTILPQPYSGHRPSPTAGLNLFDAAVRTNDLHAPTRGGVGNLGRVGTTQHFPDPSGPRRRPDRSVAHGYSKKPLPGDIRARGTPNPLIRRDQRSKYFTGGLTGQGVPSASTTRNSPDRRFMALQDDVDEDPLNILPSTSRQSINSPEHIAVPDSDEDEGLEKDFPAPTATASASGTSTTQSRKELKSGHRGTVINDGKIDDSASAILSRGFARARHSDTVLNENGKPIVSASVIPAHDLARARRPDTVANEGGKFGDSASDAPALDLTKTRPSVVGRMRPKATAKSSAHLNSVVSNPMTSSLAVKRTTTQGPNHFVPYKTVWWGSRYFTAEMPNEPTIIGIRSIVPAICLYTFDVFQRSEARPAYIIPFTAIRKVTFLAHDQNPVALILSIEGQKITSRPPASDERLRPPFFDSTGSSQNTFLSTIFFEIDVGGAWWRSKVQDRELSSHEMYHRIVGRMSEVKDIVKESIRENSARSLLEAHKQEAQSWSEHRRSASRSGESSERRFDHLYPSSLSTRSRKRSRSPTQVVSERRIQRTRAQRRLNMDRTTLSPEVRETKEGQESLEPMTISNPHELMFVYPPNGVGSVNITRGDYKRLDPGEYFNDTLIEFGLKYAINQIKDTNPSLAENVHIFNSFFYKKLSSKAQSEGYQSVRKWTSKINIFDKRYIFIPINENFHWYLAIIFMPMLVLPLDGIPVHMPSDTRSSARLAIKGTPSNARRSPDARPAPQVVVEADRSTASNHTSPSPADGSRSVDEMVTSTSEVTLSQSDPEVTERVVHVIDDSASEKPASGVTPDGGEQMDIDQKTALANDSGDTNPEPEPEPEPEPVEELESEESEGAVCSGTPSIPRNAKRGATPSGKKRPAEKPEVAKARIFLLDSLGVEHPQPRRILAQYLLQEAHDKKLIPQGSINDPSMKAWFKERTAGHNVKVPVQPNHCDCGVYLVHFAETFLSNPTELALVMPNARLSAAEKNTMWRKKDVESKRDLMRERMQKLAEEWQSIQSTSHSKDHAATSPEPVTFGAVETPAVGSIRGGKTAEPPLHMIAHSSPIRQQSTEAGEVEAMLESRSSVSLRGLSPSDQGMDLDQPDYQPDPAASSIMFPPVTPPRTIHSGSQPSLSTPQSIQPAENAYSYSLEQTPLAGSDLAPFHLSTRATLEYPQSASSRTPRSNGRAITQDSDEESPSPPRSSVGDQSRAQRLPAGQDQPARSPEMQTLSMPLELRSDGSLAPDQLAPNDKSDTRDKQLPDDINAAEAASDASSDIVVVESNDHMASSKPTAVKSNLPPRFSAATRSRAGSSRREASLPKSQHPKGVSPPDPVSEVEATVIRAHDATRVSPRTMRTYPPGTGPATRIR